MAKQPWIKAFTTNLPHEAARVSEYESYARGLVTAVPDHHISFEVFSDNIPEMIGQARRISEWGPTHIDRNKIAKARERTNVATQSSKTASRTAPAEI
jgi:hypothetical protein